MSTPLTPPAGTAAGTVLTRVPVVLAAAVAALTAVAVPLVLLDLWTPAVAVPVGLVAAVLAGRLAWGVPAVAAGWWAAGGSLAIALAGGLWAALTHAEHVVLRRDAGSLALYAHHLATRHGLPVDPDLAALGGAAALADPNLTIASPAFYEVGDHVVPQFLLGAPALYSLGEWAGGWTGLFVVPALLGAAGILALAGFTARVAGPRWAPLAAGAFALAQPVLHANRSTYSEPPALLVLVGAASLLVALVPATGRTAARLGGGAGLLLGACGFVRIDFLREIAVLVPVVAVLLVARHPGARALLAGTAVSSVLAVAAALLTSRPYLGTIAGSLLPLVAGLVLLCAVCAVLVRLARSGRLARLRWLTGERLPTVLAALLAVVLLVLASRPLWLVVRQDPQDPGSRLVAGLQLAQGLPVDGGRTYAEHSVDWVAWYLGWPAVVLAGAAAVLALPRLVRAVQGVSPLPVWTVPYVVAMGSTLLTLYRPGITPDHPWADRRLVVVVLPAVVVLAVVAARAVVRRYAHQRLTALRVAIAAVLLLVPAAVATLPVAAQRSEAGQPAAVAEACASFGGDDVALAVDPRSRNEWPQVLRGTCGVPSASVVVPTASGAPGSEEYWATLGAAVERAAQRVRAAGGNPVLVAAGGDTDPVQVLTRLGVAQPRVVTSIRTGEDERVLEERPDGLQRIDVRLVTGVAPAAAAPAAG
ncbi:hypothetical protein [Kineococcus radiotolerans]|uniref:Glycosyltransferase RgtA/B/C/D-like domain-containing protein n=1 Tax=Kineococcus radiotolerans (strain ATCC BAA-149 / DSM 14245 / SRS30216) TaxID=266940 RepID=A6WEU1_KINRD|nr:hypothetical protein [Kineococcus radiotolerans]ABS05330.1 hypothetical protein Krad_3867 [Kineococcus radiotolerans SRS30216 = ATCC BAA-149]